MLRRYLFARYQPYMVRVSIGAILEGSVALVIKAKYDSPLLMGELHSPQQKKMYGRIQFAPIKIKK